MTSPRPILIIHGWSDNSDSFEHLGKLISENIKRDVHLINLANYVSLDDSVTMDDLVSTMDRAWCERRLPREPYSIDVVVHSTGGLIIRDWMTRFFTSKTVPIKNLVMLAPANFGSPLAQKGRALIGRIVVGLQSKKLFQTGAQILKALELASPYSWSLALRDRFGEDEYYGPGKILCTVLIGNQGYQGIRAAANEPGMDGVVRLSTANLNCALLDVDFTQNPKTPHYQFKLSKGMTAFGIMSGENHATIAAKENGPLNPETLPNIYLALSVSDEGFPAWCQALAHTNECVMQQGAEHSRSQGYQTTVCYLGNQYNKDVTDYFLEFFSTRENDDQLSEYFHSKVIYSVHGYQDNPSYRSLFINCTKLNSVMTNGYDALNVSLTAMPAFDGEQLVGYRTYSKEDFGELTLSKENVAQLFQQNRTLFVNIKILREQNDALFQISQVSDVDKL